MKKNVFTTGLSFLLTFGSLAAQHSVSGTILKAGGEPFAGAWVRCEDENGTITTTFTNQDGQYEFANLEAGKNYILDASADQDNYQDGLTVLDIAKIGCGVLGTELLQPYQVLAGDLNRNGGITTFDMVLAKKLLFGELNFMQVPVWQFVNPDFEIEPFGVRRVSYSIALNNLQTDKTGQNFTAIKSGSGVIDEDALTPVASVNPSFQLVPHPVQNGVLKVDMVVENFTNIGGFQFGLEWDPGILDNPTVIEPGAANDQFFQYPKIDQGQILFVSLLNRGFDGIDLPDGTVLFTLVYDVLDPNAASAAIEFIDDAEFRQITVANFCDLGLGNHVVQGAVAKLTTTTSAQSVETTTNRLVLGANPAENGQALPLFISVEKNQKARISISDLNGRILKTETSSLHEGEQTMNFALPQMASGIYLLNLEGEHFRSVEKILIR